MDLDTNTSSLRQQFPTPHSNHSLHSTQS